MKAPPLFRSPFFLPWLYPGLVWRMPQDHTLYLTFDDGPVPGPTEFVLDQLKHFQIKATFFCIGDNVRKHPQVFQSILDEGHSVGNHTFNHLSGWKTAFDNYISNTEACEQLLRPHRNSGVPLFRPPYGRITRKQIAALKEYRIIMWDVLTHDYAAAVSPAQCLAGTIRAVRNGSIIVFHDSLKAARNMEYTLPRFLDWALQKGYQFKRLDDQ